MRRLAGLVLLALLDAAPLAAQRSLAIPSFHSRVAVNRDGSIDVAETIDVRFTGSWNGIYRQVPVEYRTPQGFNWSIRLTLLGATDETGASLRTEASRNGHYVKYKIWVPGAHDAEHTVTLRYRATNALRFFDDHDELYWNATGDEWDVPLGMVSAEVILPDGATGLREAAFSGAMGATQQEALISGTGTSVSFRMPRPLQFREGLTVVVGWDKGLVTAPTATDKAAGFLASNWPLALPLPVLAGMLLLWFRTGRDPRRLPVTVQYEPPPDLTPAEAGTLTDERVDMRDITATVVDLAVRGYLRIEEKEEEAFFGLTKRTAITFHRLKAPAEWSTLAPHEQSVLEGVFRDGATAVPLSDLKDEFYKELPDIKQGVQDRLMSRQLYRSRPDTVRTIWVGAGVVTGALVAIGGSALSGRFSLTPVPFVVAGVLVGLIVVIIGWNMPARTVAGARMLERLLGFGEFLERVDREQYQDVKRTPEMFEKFLPFAMVFGVEKQWARAFRDIYTEPPRWYTGSNYGAFNVSSFSHSLSAMTAQTASTMTSAPRTSSGSGFSGGFSGGGGGGGGGGGF